MRGGFRQFYFWKSWISEHPNVHVHGRTTKNTVEGDWKCEGGVRVTRPEWINKPSAACYQSKQSTSGFPGKSWAHSMWQTEKKICCILVGWLVMMKSVAYRLKQCMVAKMNVPNWQKSGELLQPHLNVLGAAYLTLLVKLYMYMYTFSYIQYECYVYLFMDACSIVPTSNFFQ